MLQFKIILLSAASCYSMVAAVILALLRQIPPASADFNTSTQFEYSPPSCITEAFIRCSLIANPTDPTITRRRLKMARRGGIPRCPNEFYECLKSRQAACPLVAKFLLNLAALCESEQQQLPIQQFNECSMAIESECGAFLDLEYDGQLDDVVDTFESQTRSRSQLACALARCSATLSSQSSKFLAACSVETLQLLLPQQSNTAADNDSSIFSFVASICKEPQIAVVVSEASSRKWPVAAPQGNVDSTMTVSVMTDSTMGQAAYLVDFAIVTIFATISIFVCNSLS